MQTFFFLDLYQDNVISYLTDTVPGNHIFTFPAKKAAESARTRNNQSCNPSCCTVKLYIHWRSQTPTGTGIDDFFLFQFT